MQRKEMIKDLISALDVEITAVKRKKKYSTYNLYQGRKISTKGENNIYEFNTDGSVNVMEDYPARIVINGENHECTIITRNETRIQISIGTDQGHKINESKLKIESWKLLEKLKTKMFSQREKDNYFSKSFSLLHFENRKRERPFYYKQSRNSTFKLNDAQLDAINQTLNNTISFIWGPPGTGKTATIAQIVMSLYLESKSVLITSLSNNAVDQALFKIIEDFNRHKINTDSITRLGLPKKELLICYSEEDYQVLLWDKLEKKEPSLTSSLKRYQSEVAKLNSEISEIYEKLEGDKRQNPMLLAKQKRLKTQRDNWTKKISESFEALEKSRFAIVKDSQIVGTTLTKTYTDKYIKDSIYDVIIVDEASMVPLPMLFWAASKSKSKIVIVGDFCQLVPICSAENNRFFSDNIYQYLGIGSSDIARENITMLNTQYRMNPEISEIINSYFYNNKLSNSPSVSNNSITDSISKNNPVILIDTSFYKPPCTQFRSGGRVNVFQALLCVALVQRIKKDLTSCETIGILTPYNKQVRLIGMLLQDLGMDERVKVNTIHSFQGGEESVIIFDTVDSEGLKPSWNKEIKQKNPVWTMLNEENNPEAKNLINVAISRAQKKLYVIGHSQFFIDQYQPKIIINRIFADLSKKRLMPSTDILSAFSKQTGTASERRILKQEIIQDVDSCKKELIIFTKSYSLQGLEGLKPVFKKLKERKVAILIMVIAGKGWNNPRTSAFTNELKKDQIEFMRIESYNRDNLVVIDRKVLWYGLMDVLTEKPIDWSFRIEKAKFISELIGFLGINDIKKRLGFAKIKWRGGSVSNEKQITLADMFTCYEKQSNLIIPKTTLIKSKLDNGIVVEPESSQTVKEGLHVEYYENGRIKSRKQYENGLLHGEYLKFHANGRKKLKAGYKKGKLHGKHEERYPDGRKHIISSFVAGKREGEVITKFDNGVIQRRDYYKDDKLLPFDVSTQEINFELLKKTDHKELYDNGNLKVRAYFDAKKQMVVREEYFLNGKLHKREYYPEGTKREVKVKAQIKAETESKAKEDCQIEYYSNGQKYIASCSVNGIDEGTRIGSSPAGQIYNTESHNDEEIIKVASKPEVKTEYEKKISKNKIEAKNNSNNIKNGEHLEYYDNGRVKSISDYLNGEKNGTSIEYYENGVKDRITNYLNGKKDGKFISYYRNGNILVECYYQADKREGDFVRYFMNGALHIKSFFKQDQLYGKRVEYKKNGEILSSEDYKINKMLMAKKITTEAPEMKVIEPSVPPSKDIAPKVTTTREPKQYSVYKPTITPRKVKEDYYDNGQLRSHFYYIDGKIDGEYIMYFETGTISFKTNYIDGQKNGVSVWYNENGTINSTTNYKDDKKQGKYIKYYENGNKEAEISYYNDKKHGEQIYYLENGEIDFIVNYANGVVID